MLLRDRLVGVIYLDSQVIKGLFTEDDARILCAIASQLALSLETARLARLESLEQDLALTAAVQTLFLPKAASIRTESFELHGYYQAARRCSGDWWWYADRKNETPACWWVMSPDTAQHRPCLRRPPRACIDCSIVKTRPHQSTKC